MANIDSLLQELKNGIVDLAKNEGKQYANQVQADGEAFVNASEADFRLWATQLSEGKLSKEDFASLIRGKKQVATMKALTAVGVAAASKDRIQTAIINLAVNALIKAV